MMMSSSSSLLLLPVRILPVHHPTYPCYSTTWREHRPFARWTNGSCRGLDQISARQFGPVMQPTIVNNSDNRNVKDSDNKDRDDMNFLKKRSKIKGSLEVSKCKKQK